MSQQEHDKFCWTELGALMAGGQMHRNHFVHADDAPAIKQWCQTYSDCDVFQSMCCFSEPKRGHPCLCDFVLDIDCTDLGAARKDTLSVFNQLKERLDICPESVDLAFSGCKGFHVIVPRAVFGEPDCPEILWIWKNLARRLFEEGIEHIDLGIYDPSRLLRRVNTINSRSGLYKVALEYKELADCGIDYVLEIARSPREWTCMAMPEESPKPAAWFTDALAWVRDRRHRTGGSDRQQCGRFREGWRIPPCIKALEQAALPDGMRHSAYFALARFYAWIGMHPDAIEGKLQEIDQKRPIRDPDYIGRVVQSGRKHPGFPGCHDLALRKYCDRRKCFRTEAMSPTGTAQEGCTHETKK
jgi:hypothetical protein